MNEVIQQVLQGIEQGALSADDVSSLEKALTAGYGYAGKPTDLTYGGVIQVESLETTLKSVTFDMKNLKFWPAISIDKASNLFEQYNRLTSHGGDSVPYIGEGGAPQEEDSTYVRDGKRIVFFGTRRKVSHPMTLVQTSVGDVVSRQAHEGTMHLLGQIERELYWGHAHFVNAAGGMTGSAADQPHNSLAMDGLLMQLLVGDTDEQMRSGDFEGYGAFQSIVKELDGQPMTQEDIETLAVVLLENFGQPDQIHLEPLALSSFVRQFYPQFRSAPGLANQTVGYDVNKVTTTAGVIDLKPNLFLRPKSRAKAIGHDHGPSIAGMSLAASAGGSGSNIEDGDYWYRVTLVNDKGESSPISLAAPVSVNAGEKVTLALSGGSLAGVKYVRVYRSAPGGALQNAEFIGNYRVALAGAMVDAGVKLPGRGEGFMLDMRAECMRFKQLAPLSKINFAIVSTALEFAILLYGALFVYTPRFNGVFRNVGV